MSGCGPFLKMKLGVPGLVLFLLHLVSVHTAGKYVA